MEGFIHSFQSMGAVDGPGIRYVVFLQGCPLRCVYCHNPDTWGHGGTAYTAKDVAERILRYRSYFGEDGGVTLSGGEALLQPEFAAELFDRLQEEGIHTALDTSGIGDLKKAEEVLCHTDLVLCDIKFATEEAYQQHTGGSLHAVQDFLKLCAGMDIPLWVRHVVVPGLTDSEEQVAEIIRLAGQYHNLQRIELLPFRKLCVSKYAALGLTFPLECTPPCPSDTIDRLKALIPEEYR